MKCFKYVFTKILSVLYQSAGNDIRTTDNTVELYECAIRLNCQLITNNPNIC